MNILLLGLLFLATPVHAETCFEPAPLDKTYGAELTAYNACVAANLYATNRAACENQTIDTVTYKWDAAGDQKCTSSCTYGGYTDIHDIKHCNFPPPPPTPPGIPLGVQYPDQIAATHPPSTPAPTPITKVPPAVAAHKMPAVTISSTTTVATTTPEIVPAVVVVPPTPLPWWKQFFRFFGF